MRCKRFWRQLLRSSPLPSERYIRAIVRFFVLRWSTQDEQIGQRVQHICRGDLVINAVHECLPCVFVDCIQRSTDPAVRRTILNKVMGPDMVGRSGRRRTQDPSFSPSRPFFFSFEEPPALHAAISAARACGSHTIQRCSAGQSQCDPQSARIGRPIR